MTPDNLELPARRNMRVCESCEWLLRNDGRNFVCGMVLKEALFGFFREDRCEDRIVPVDCDRHVAHLVCDLNQD